VFTLIYKKIKKMTQGIKSVFDIAVAVMVVVLKKIGL
jgi:hypothetical protein